MDSSLAVGGPSEEDRTWAMAAHLSALVAVAMPFGHLIGPLVVYLVRGKESAFVAAHARASLNYQLTLSIAAVLAVGVGVLAFIILAISAGAEHRYGGDSVGTTTGLAAFTLWGIVVLAVLFFFVLSVVFIIQGTIAANQGRTYDYPFAIRFIR